MKGSDSVHLVGEVPETLSGKRLDSVLAVLFSEYSRTRLKEWVLQGALTVNQKPICRVRDKVFTGDKLEIRATQTVVSEWAPEPIELEIVFEDEALLVVNKPANLVVHPAAGNWSGTLVNALLHYCPALETLPRAGVVHRLDKDTTGLLVVAKTLSAQHSLVKQLQARTIQREYEAIVNGVLLSGGRICAPIGRHPKRRLLMSVVDSGKEAITHYRVLRQFENHTHLRVNLETGRTHQIRVHLAHIRHAVVGDKLYGSACFPKGATESLREALMAFPRQALHAKRLRLQHPVTETWQEWESELPEDMQTLLEQLGSHKIEK